MYEALNDIKRFIKENWLMAAVVGGFIWFALWFAKKWFCWDGGDMATWAGAIGAFIAIIGSAFVAYSLAHREAVQARNRDESLAAARLRNISELVFATENTLFLLQHAVQEPKWSHAEAHKFDYQLEVLKNTLEPLAMELPSQSSISYLLNLLRRVFVLKIRLASSDSWTIEMRSEFATKVEHDMNAAKLLRAEIDEWLPPKDRKVRVLGRTE